MHPPVLRIERIIIITSCCAGGTESVSNLHTLDRSDGHYGFGKVRIQFIEYGFSNPGRHAVDDAFDDAAQRVLVFHAFFQMGRRFQRIPKVWHIERIIVDTSIVIFRFRHGDRADCLGISGDADSQPLEDLGCNGSCGNPPDCLPPGGPAAAPVVPDAVFGVKGVICMSRTIAVFDFAIVPGALVLVMHDNGDWRSGGLAVKDAREELCPVCFASRRGEFALPRFPAVQKLLYILSGKGQPCGAAVDNGSDCRAVGFPPCRECK